LAGLGFSVTLGTDLSGEALRARLEAFSRSLKPGDVSVFYYAGHGLQVDGQNYLIPVDAKLERPADLKLVGHRLDDIIEAISAADNTAIVLLDACRDNPFAGKLVTAPLTRAINVSAGLAAVEAGKGVYIAFATQPGSAAYDGGGQNSPFAEALLRHIATPGVDIEIMMRRVRADVMARTDNLQVPWSNSSLVEPGFSFAPAQRPNEHITTSSASADVEYWKAVSESGDAKLLAGYLATFPDGLFVKLARDRLAKLEVEAKPKGNGEARAKGSRKVTSRSSKTAAPLAQPSKTRSTSRQTSTPPSRRVEPNRTVGGRCRDGNVERCRLNCSEGRRGACRMLRRLGG